MTTDPCAIGFRVEPSKFHWAVVSGTRGAPKLVDCDTYVRPAVDKTDSKALSSFRRETKDLCERFKPRTAWIRESERTPGGQDLLMQRCRVEGVIVEILDSLGVTSEIGALVSLTKVLLHPEVKPRTIKPALAEEQFHGIDWAAYEKNRREAILSAVAALERP